MPIVAVAVAVVADVSAVSGAIAGTLGVFEAVGAIGATVAAVGAVTGNKALTIAGSVLGGIGGVGSLASSAGLIGDPTVGSFFGSSSGASTAASVSDAASGATPLQSMTGDLVGSAPTETFAADGSVLSGASSAASGASSDIINNLAGTNTAGGLNPGLPDPTNFGLPANTTSIGDTTALSTPPSGAADASASSGATAGVTSNIPQPVGSGVTDASTAGSAVTGTPAVSSDSGFLGNVFGKIGSFVNNDKSGMVKYGLIQAAGSLVGGLFDPLKPAQVAALDAQAAANRAATKLSLTQQANMAQPIPVATRTAPNQPQPAAVTGIPAGMINQPIATPVTGMVGT